MVSRSGRYAVSVLVACVLLAGCQPVSSPLPAPTPSLRCTAEAGGAEYDCTPYEYDDMVAKDKLYAEAEAVYRKFFAEDERIYRAGGISEPTDVLLSTTTGAFLSDSMDLYRQLKGSGTKVVGGEILLASLTRHPGSSIDGSVVSMAACIDASTTQVVTPGQKRQRGGFGVDVLYFSRGPGDNLKIVNAQSREAESC